MTPDEFAAKLDAFGQFNRNTNPYLELMIELQREHQRLTEALAAAEQERDEIGEQLDMASEDHARELAAMRGERDSWKVHAEKHQANRDAAQADAYRARAELGVVQSMRDEAQVEAGQLRDAVGRLTEAGEHFRSEWELATNNNAELRIELADLKATVAAQSEVINRAAKIVGVESGQYNEFFAAIRQLKADLAHANGINQDVKTRLGNNRAWTAELEHEFGRMRQILDAGPDESAVNCVQRVMEENNRLKIQNADEAAQRLKVETQLRDYIADQDRLLLAIGMSAGLAGEITYGDLPTHVQRLKTELDCCRREKTRISNIGTAHRSEFTRLMNAIAPFVDVPQFTDWAKVDGHVNDLIEAVRRLKDDRDHISGVLDERIKDLLHAQTQRDAARDEIDRLRAEPTTEPSSLEARVRRLEERIFANPWAPDWLKNPPVALDNESR